MMGLTQDRLGQEYGNGQSGNVEAVGLGAKCSRCAHSTERRSTWSKTQKSLNANDNVFDVALAA